MRATAKNGVALHIQLDGTLRRFTFDGVIGERKVRAGTLVRGEPHIGSVLVVVDDKCGNVVDCAVGWVILSCENATYHGDSVANGATADVESEYDGDAGLNVREDGAAHVNTGETKRLIASLGYGPYHCVRRQAIRSVREGDGLDLGWGSGEPCDVGN